MDLPSQTSATSRRGLPTRRLLTLNLALALALGVLWMIPTPGSAQPRPGQPVRAVGQYTGISGKLNTGNAQAVYLLDAANQEMVGIKWDSGRKGILPLGYRNLINDRKAPTGR